MINRTQKKRIGRIFADDSARITNPRQRNPLSSLCAHLSLCHLFTCHLKISYREIIFAQIFTISFLDREL